MLKGIQEESDDTSDDAFLGALTPFYASMLAKLIIFGMDRADCLSRTKRALEETVIDGIKTNKDLHLRIIQHPDFIGNNYSTNFLTEKLK